MPQNSAHPTTCSMGSPAARRSTMDARSVGVAAAEMSSRASSSAKTQPAARSLASTQRAVVPTGGSMPSYCRTVADSEGNRLARDRATTGIGPTHERPVPRGPIPTLQMSCQRETLPAENE